MAAMDLFPHGTDCISACALVTSPACEATWRSGYATVCKTVYTSSILVVASKQ